MPEEKYIVVKVPKAWDLEHIKIISETWGPVYTPEMREAVKVRASDGREYYAVKKEKE